MFKYFKNILSAANDQDPDSVRLLRVVLAASVVAAAVSGILLFLTDFKVGIGTLGAETTSLLTGVLLFLSYRNHHWPGRLLLPLMLLVAFSFLAISVDGLHGSTTAGFVLVIVLASLLAGQKVIPLATVLALLGVWIVAYADMTGINKSVFAQRTDLAYVIVINFIQIVTATSLNGLMSRLNSALETSRTNIQELRVLQTVLEQRVAGRTKALQTSAEVTRRLAGILDPRLLASEVVNQVQTAFAYYYAQIYLLDEAGENLVLTGGTGEAGAAMLARGHSLPKGRGLVGRAAESNASVLIPDVLQEEGWLPNDLLPETKSEAAVPIAVGNRVLGVLDVQHNRINGLTAEDVTLLESLAGQVAITLQNARAYEESRRHAEVETLVNTIGQKIQRTTSIEETLQTAIREIGTALGAARVSASISRPTSEGKE